MRVEKALESKKENTSFIKSTADLVHQYVFQSMILTYKTLKKKRPHHMRAMIWIQMIIFACYMIENGASALTYVYMKL